MDSLETIPLETKVAVLKAQLEHAKSVLDSVIKALGELSTPETAGGKP